MSCQNYTYRNADSYPLKSPGLDSETQRGAKTDPPTPRDECAPGTLIRPPPLEGLGSHYKGNTRDPTRARTALSPDGLGGWAAKPSAGLRPTPDPARQTHSWNLYQTPAARRPGSHDKGSAGDPARAQTTLPPDGLGGSGARRFGGLAAKCPRRDSSEPGAQQRPSNTNGPKSWGQLDCSLAWNRLCDPSTTHSTFRPSTIGRAKGRDESKLV